MRIVIAHTTYQQPGGEDVVFDAEVKLLKKKGHAVFIYQRSNLEPNIETGVLWSQKSYREVRKLVRITRPDLTHFHNTFLAISPSAYYACQDEKVPVIQTLHNFRLVCPGALLLRNNQPCEDCLGRKIAWPGATHGCWRGSKTGSALVASMLSLHHALGTWQNKVDRYIALSEFSRKKFIQGGLPPEKIVVKPNFMPDPNLTKNDHKYALFVGRLSTEKGINTLLKAWQSLPEIPLRIIGGGPLSAFAREEIGNEKNFKNVSLSGQLDRKSVFNAMLEASFLIIPSKWYENFPMVLLEAFSCELPVLVPNFGNLGNLVKNGQTGLHFIPGDTQDLAEKAAWLWKNPQEAARMGQNARREYEEKYTPENNYRQLMAIYEQVLAEKKR